MAKLKSVYVCSSCGAESLKWTGKCYACGEWNTISEQVVQVPSARTAVSAAAQAPALLSEIPANPGAREKTGIGELDRVLGGGVVPGSAVLLGGDPGTGKSTILLQAADSLSRQGKKVLYVTGEESAAQIKLRAERLGLAQGIYVLAENDMDAITAAAARLQPEVVIADSIQTFNLPAMESSPGSVSQVRECAARLVKMAKSSEAAVFIVGHVTKEGAIAGPRVLEHMVDTVLYFEGERHNSYRILRAVKNRFGSTNEIGVFEMKDSGMEEVASPSGIFMAKRALGEPGSCVTCSLEGTRPLLAELQALLCPTAFGNARRMATGVDYNRFLLMLAVLEKKAGMTLFSQDAYANVAGGLRLTEPAADLALAMAVASSFRSKPLPPDMVIIGEVGLTGEVRGVARLEQRLMECKKMGFERCMLPEANAGGKTKMNGIELLAVSNIVAALGILGL